MIVSIAVVAIWLALFVRGLFGLRRIPVLVPRPVQTTFDITVLVPARDEAEVIERSIGALLSEPVREIIVVDDRSTDGTSEKLAAMATTAAPRLRVVAGVGPQPGEFGKPAALVHAIETAKPETEWLLFVDADVVLKPGTVGALMDAVREADFLSMIPQLEMHSFIEKLVMPSIGALILAANDGKPFANGQLILIRRSLYERSGGHRAVISEILEDCALAAKAAAAGGKLILADGRKIATTHMYSGWKEMREGWSRNLYLLTGGAKASAWGWLFFSTALTFLGPLAAVIDGAIGLAAWAAIALMQATLRALGGTPALYAPLAPVAALLVDAILLRSMSLHTKKKPIPWKGRTYG